jgi:hypothetical protein
MLRPDRRCAGRGFPGVRPYFEKIDLVITLHTDELPERVERLRKSIEFRYPVTNLIRRAGVDLSVEWRILSA